MVLPMRSELYTRPSFKDKWIPCPILMYFHREHSFLSVVINWCCKILLDNLNLLLSLCCMHLPTPCISWYTCTVICALPDTQTRWVWVPHRNCLVKKVDWIGTAFYTTDLLAPYHCHTPILHFNAENTTTITEVFCLRHPLNASRSSWH